MQMDCRRVAMPPPFPAENGRRAVFGKTGRASAPHGLSPSDAVAEGMVKAQSLRRPWEKRDCGEYVRRL